MNKDRVPFRRRSNTKWIIPSKWNGNFFDIVASEGVYVLYAFLGDNERRPVYVGKTKNLQRRLYGHEIDRLLYKNDIYASCKIKYCSNPVKLEAELIKKIKPIFNLQHNKEFVKNVYLNHVVGELQRKKKENTLDY